MTSKTGSGYEAWKARRAAKAATDEEAYRQYVDAATGATAQENAGRVNTGEPGMGSVDLSEADLSDDELYAAYRSQLDGSADRRRAEQSARQERQDRAQEHRRHAQHHGTPEPTQYSD